MFILVLFQLGVLENDQQCCHLALISGRWLVCDTISQLCPSWNDARFETFYSSMIVGESALILMFFSVDRCVPHVRRSC